MGLFGIGDCKIELAVPSTEIRPNGVLEGTVTITLNRDVMATGVFATLEAVRHAISNVRNTSTFQNIAVYQKIQQLDTERRYLKQDSPLTYSFRFVVPELTEAMQSTREGLSEAFNPFSTDGTKHGPVTWSLKAKLDIPHALEMETSKSQSLQMITDL